MTTWPARCAATSAVMPVSDSPSSPLPGRGRIDPAWQGVSVGDRVPDYGPGGWFEAGLVDPPHALVWWSERGRGLRYT